MPRYSSSDSSEAGSVRLFVLAGAQRRHPAVEDWFSKPADPLRAIARHRFEEMRTRGTDVLEILHDGQPTACVDDAAFGYVDAFKNHVNVGFFLGATLPDSAGLLEGNGRFMRHAKIRPGVSLDEEALRGLIDAAYHQMRELKRGV
jgi:hypothetical protein